MQEVPTTDPDSDGVEFARRRRLLPKDDNPTDGTEESEDGAEKEITGVHTRNRGKVFQFNYVEKSSGRGGISFPRLF